MNLPQQIAEAVRDICGGGELQLHVPYIAGKEQEYIKQVINSGHISAGKWVDRFEDELAAFIGAKHAIAVCNATCGLHSTLVAMGCKPGFDIGMPALTFMATANAVKHANATPYFMEGLKDLLEPMPHGIISVHLLGHATDWGKLGVSLVLQDAAQALGSRLNGQYVGGNGTAVFSFNQNKIITTGGGGMIVTDDDGLAAHIRHIVTTARIPHKWECECDTVGFNYRLSDLQAAMGVAQLEQLPVILKAKRALAAKYIAAFDNISGVKSVKEKANNESNYWLNAIVLDDSDQLIPTLEALHADGILARRLWKPLHLTKPYRDYPRGNLAATEDLYARTVCLPSSAQLGMKYA